MVDDMMQGPNVAAGMSADTVGDDPQAPTVGFIQPLTQGGVAAKQGIDVRISTEVVAVVRGRSDDRGQAPRGDAERLARIERVHKAQQGAALNPLLLRETTPRPPLNDSRGRVVRTAGETSGKL